MSKVAKTFDQRVEEIESLLLDYRFIKRLDTRGVVYFSLQSYEYQLDNTFLEINKISLKARCEIEQSPMFFEEDLFERTLVDNLKFYFKCLGVPTREEIEELRSIG